MVRKVRSSKWRAGVGVVVCAVFVLAGCGTASNDEAAPAEPDTGEVDAAPAELDLSEVSFDVRRDPG